MTRARRSNPLALAVLVTLFDGPMHPYDIARTLQFRQHDRSMRLNFGSLYSVVGSLAQRQFIHVVGTERAGNRPERTVYAITESGRGEALDWLADLLGRPVKEYPRFEAGLTLAAALPPNEVIDLLAGRLASLEQQLAIDSVTLASGQAAFQLPRVFLLEAEYELAMRRAEVEFVRGLLAELRSGTFPDVALWQSIADGTADLSQFPSPSQEAP